LSNNLFISGALSRNQHSSTSIRETEATSSENLLPEFSKKLELEMRGKAQRVARPAQTRLQNSGIIGPKFTQI